MRHDQTGLERRVEQVFPVFVTGLHCGITIIGSTTPTVRVFPVFVTGLHCGVLNRDTTVTTWKVFPVFVTGLHCGQLGGRFGWSVN